MPCLMMNLTVSLSCLKFGLCTQRDPYGVYTLCVFCRHQLALSIAVRQGLYIYFMLTFRHAEIRVQVFDKIRFTLKNG